MKVKGILFDKDGTLIDFYSLWLNIALDVIPKFLEINSIDNNKECLVTYILENIGVKEGTVDPQGALAYKSYYYIAEDIHNALLEKEINISVEKIHMQIVELFNEAVTKETVEFKTFTDVKNLMKELKKLNISVGLATADTTLSAKRCLEKLGILQYFTFVGGDDGVLSPKPEPDMFNTFAELSGLEKEEIIIVGDTLCDMKFAKKCGSKSVAVLSGVTPKEKLIGKADYIIPSVDNLISLIKSI